MKKRLSALIMAVVLVVSLAACGNNTPSATSTPTPTSTTAPSPTQEAAKPTPTPLPNTDPSIDFEDGKLDFVAVYKNFATADDSKLEIADFNGSKALKVTKGDPKKTPIIAIDIYSLLGDAAANVARVAMTLGTSYEDGSFSATAGQILYWTDTQMSKMAGGNWSVYVKSKNPTVANIAVPKDVTLGADVPVVLVYMKEDIGIEAHGGATLYIDNIAFLDKDGKSVKPASTEVAFKAPNGFYAADRSNLLKLGDTVEIPGFNVGKDGWNQDGKEMPQEFIDAIVPGSTIEISYSSEDGNIWLVFPGCTKGWMRVGDGKWAGNDHSEVYRNGIKTTAQIDYDQIVELCGEDKSGWGNVLQCEGSSKWEVYSVKVGKAVEEKKYVKAVEFEGFACSNKEWSQSGFDFPQEILDALVPGTVLELNYTSEDGTLWIVLPNATAGWMRVGDGDFCGNGHSAATLVDGSKCYVTYEQIVELCGEDKATWGPQLQAEARTPWEVYSCSVGKLESTSQKVFKATKEFEGFACSNKEWSQSGFDFPQEILDALVPGTVIELSYTSEDGTLWIVLPNATAGWMRVGDGDFCGNGHSAAVLVDGNKCYVTYEQIVELCGEDKAGWGPQLQAEARTPWEVYSVKIGTLEDAPSVPRLHNYTEFSGFATSGKEWSQSGFDFTQEVLDALVPGSVLEIDYASEDGTLWIVLPNATAGWMRVGDGDFCGNGHSAAVLVDGNKCYVTYEQIVELCGEDKAGWGPQLQAEARTPWEVYSVKVGQK